MTTIDTGSDIETFDAATDLSITGEVPAIDHHSHAAYVRPGETLDTFEALEIELTAGYVESRIPAEAYRAFIDAQRAGDKPLAEGIADQHGIYSLQDRGRELYDTTGFGRALRLGCDLLYGPVGRAQQLQMAAERLEDYRGLYDDALRISRTSMVLTDVPELDPASWPAGRYRQIARIDPYLYPFGHDPYRGRGSDTPRFAEILAAKLTTELQQESLKTVPSNLDEYRIFVTDSLTRRIRGGVAGLKIVSAYVRSLNIEHVELDEARSAYQELRAAPAGDQLPGPRKALSDYLIADIAHLAVRCDLPIQIHVGMGHSEPGLRLVNADPLLLEEFLHTPSLNRLQVVLIHGGYPYWSKLGALAHAFGNVYLDYSWMPYLHQHLTSRVLQEWLEFLPAHKVLYGTDTAHPEIHVAATVRAREALEYVLQEGLRDRLWTPAQADLLAARVLHTNVAELYGLES